MTKEQYEAYTLLNVNLQQLKTVTQYINNVGNAKLTGILNIALDECTRVVKEEMEKI